jgi:maleate isomerase
MPDTLSPRKILGVLVPYFNTVVQPELDDLRPAGVSNQTARFTLDAAVVQNIREAAEKLTACGPEALLIGLSTEAFPNGLALLAQGAGELHEGTGLPVFTASHATHAALRHLGATRVGVVTPFDAGANEHVRAALESAGFVVTGIQGLACPSPDRIPHAKLSDLRRAFAEADSAAAEALVHVGTGLPVVHLIDELEGNFDKPVVACNAALYWQALRETGIADPIRGFGRLLAAR